MHLYPTPKHVLLLPQSQSPSSLLTVNPDPSVQVAGAAVFNRQHQRLAFTEGPSPTAVFCCQWNCTNNRRRERGSLIKVSQCFLRIRKQPCCEKQWVSADDTELYISAQTHCVRDYLLQGCYSAAVQWRMIKCVFSSLTALQHCDVWVANPSVRLKETGKQFLLRSSLCFFFFSLYKLTALLKATTEMKHSQVW